MAVHRRRRLHEKKLSALESIGHGSVHVDKLSKKQLNQIKKKGYVYVTIKGVRKRVTPANVRNNKIYWYMRSDTKKPALRNFKRDRGYKARRRAVKGKGYSGD